MNLFHQRRDANTRFFHLRANGRHQKNYIQRLHSWAGWVVNHNDKQNFIHDHLENVMADPPPHIRNFNWHVLLLETSDLSSLGRPFSEEEIWQAICQMPQDKAPGPDGFTRHFFRKCWQIVRYDIVADINSFYDLRCHDLNLINKANVILVPKEGAEDICDFKPISLIHAIAKIITKVLAL
jgi:hypothetical protein